MEPNQSKPSEVSDKRRTFLQEGAKRILGTGYKAEIAPIIENTEANEHMDKLNECMKTLNLLLLFSKESSVEFIPGQMASEIEALMGRKEGLLELERRGELDIAKALPAAVHHGHPALVEWLLQFEIELETLDKCLYFMVERTEDEPQNLDKWTKIRDMLQRKCPQTADYFEASSNKKILRNEKMREILHTCISRCSPNARPAAQVCASNPSGCVGYSNGAPTGGAPTGGAPTRGAPTRGSN